jgi:glycosyltransferase involved in cell wall biosynthesis
MAIPASQPLVSVGLPIYNRLDGLKTTLANICNQSYRNLEVIVSDNCSPDPAIQEYMVEAAGRDSRIRYVRQAVNIGLVRNFLFVQAAATGDYFMWAADDDEHEPDFIERCMRGMLSAPNISSVMTPSEIHLRARQQKLPITMPMLSAGNSDAENLRHFFAAPEPNILYGVHRSVAIRWLLECDTFPWMDCYFLCRLMLEGWKIVVLPGHVSYAAGVDAQDYEAKPLDERPGRGFRYMPYFSAMMRSISRSRRLTSVQKLEFSMRSTQFILTNFVKWQRRANPLLCRFHRAFTLRALSLALKLFPKVR